MRLAIADPPYPPHFAERRDRPDGNVRILVRSRARRHYGDGTRPADERKSDHHDQAGEWDQPAGLGVGWRRTDARSPVVTVCANRSDNPGFFTPCESGGRKCVCGAQVAAELKAASDLDNQENR